MGGVPPTSQKFAHPICTIFVLISYCLYTQVMLILILTDVQFSQKAVFSFEKGQKGQNHSSSGSNHQVKKSPPAKFINPPVPPLNTI